MHCLRDCLSWTVPDNRSATRLGSSRVIVVVLLLVLVVLVVVSPLKLKCVLRAKLAHVRFSLAGQCGLQRTSSLAAEKGRGSGNCRLKCDGERIKGMEPAPDQQCSANRLLAECAKLPCKFNLIPHALGVPWTPW